MSPAEESARRLALFRDRLTDQQYKTLNGLIKAGDTAGADKGLFKIIRRNKRRDSDGTAARHSDRHEPENEKMEE